MDLIGGYLLIILVLFSVNIALFVGNYKINTLKLILLSLSISIVSFVLMYASKFLNARLSFLLDYFSHIFILLSIIIFIGMFLYTKKGYLKISGCLILSVFILSTLLVASQSALMLFDSVLYSLLSFIIIFSVYQVTKLLIHAKRPYPVIVGEYMSLFSMLVFILGVTYDSTRFLDYSMFSPFLILTPTYELIYIIIGIIVMIIIGVVYNDNKGGIL